MKEMKQTVSGISYRRIDAMQPFWSEYETRVAMCHLNNYGCIFVDGNDSPIDNEFELEEIAADRFSTLSRIICSESGEDHVH